MFGGLNRAPHYILHQEKSPLLIPEPKIKARVNTPFSEACQSNFFLLLLLDDISDLMLK